MKRTLFISAVLFLLMYSCKEQQDNQQTNEDKLKLSFNVFVEQCWNNKDVEKFNNISSENFVRNVNGIKVTSNQSEMQAAMNVFFTGFPDLSLTVKNVVVKNNQIFAHWTFTGSNTGIFGETPATGKKVKIIGYTNAHYTKEGKLYREDVYYNELELLQQLGYSLIPPIVE